MFGSFLGRSKRGNVAKEASSRVLSHVVQLCPRCRLPLHGHEYRLIAATILTPDHLDRFRELLSAIRNHQWGKVLTFQDWEGDQRNAEVYGIKCPGGRLSLVIISAPFALEEPHTLMHQQTVDDNAATLVTGLPECDTWHTF
jgi:hypothetical protein